MSAQRAVMELEDTVKPIADARIAAAKLLGSLHERGDDLDIADRERMVTLLGEIMVAVDWIDCAVDNARMNLPERKRGPTPMDLELARRGLQTA